MREPNDQSGPRESTISVPIVEERAEVGSRKVVKERAVINKKVEEREELVDLPLLSENYRVERVPINRTVDASPEARCVGDTTIIPIVEEVAVITKQLVLREELHITRIRTEVHHTQSVSLKRETAEVLTMPLEEHDLIDTDSGVITMAKTVVGLFDDRQKTQAVIHELGNAGFPESGFHCLTVHGDNGESSDIPNDLIRAGVPSEEVSHYSGEVQNGKSVLVLQTSNEAVQAAVNVLERNGAKDLDQRRGSATAAIGGDQTTGLGRSDAGSTKTTIPVVEEELKVGKREIQAGGFRIYTRVAEQPVEQEVSLRQEHIDVERRPVNRPATERDLRGLKEGSIEVTATAEEPVISKEARVVEEVVVSKDVSQQTQTVRDTVRKTEVDVDKQTGATTGAKSEAYRENIAGQPPNASSIDQDYAYTYGQKLASDPRYRGKDWSSIEAEAQREWGTHHKGAWEEFKENVRHAWEKMTGR